MTQLHAEMGMVMLGSNDSVLKENLSTSHVSSEFSEEKTDLAAGLLDKGKDQSSIIVPEVLEGPTVLEAETTAADADHKIYKTGDLNVDKEDTAELNDEVIPNKHIGQNEIEREYSDAISDNITSL